MKSGHQKIKNNQRYASLTSGIDRITISCNLLHQPVYATIRQAHGKNILGEFKLMTDENQQQDQVIKSQQTVNADLPLLAISIKIGKLLQSSFK